MDIFTDNYQQALNRLSQNEDFKFVLAYLKDEYCSKSAFSPTNDSATMYNLGKQELIKELEQRLSEAVRGDINNIVERYSNE